MSDLSSSKVCMSNYLLTSACLCIISIQVQISWLVQQLQPVIYFSTKQNFVQVIYSSGEMIGTSTHMFSNYYQCPLEGIGAFSVLNG